MSQKQILFSYGDLFEYTELYRNQPHVAEGGPRGASRRIYSTGRLERHAGKRATVWVVCASKSALEKYDDWWSSLLPKERIFLAMPSHEISNRGWESEPKEVTRFLWEALYEAALGISLPRYIRDDDAAKAHLVQHHGFLLGTSVPATTKAPTP